VQNIIHTLRLHHDPRSLLQFSYRTVGAPGIVNLWCESLICAPVTTAPNSQAQTAPLMPMARSD